MFMNNGAGTEFVIKLPQKVVSMEAMGKLRENYENIQKISEAYHETFTAPKAKVLVVDDNEMNIKVVTKLLGANQIQIDTALDGRKAIEMAEKNQYHMIFLDHMMPKMDGIETLKLLKEKNLVNDTPVIALTANAVSGARQQYLAKGFQDYMSKPVSGEQLEKKLLKWLPSELIKHTAEVEQEEIVQEEQLNKTEQYIYGQLEQISELNIDKALGYSGDGKKGVVWNIRLYLKQVQNNIDKLSSFLENEQIEDYAIVVHALKSNLALIGEESLSEMAKGLEMAGKQSDMEYIVANHSVLMDKLKVFNEQLNIAYEKKIKHDTDNGNVTQNTDDNDSELLLALIRQLKEATDNYDVIGMEEAKEQLKTMNEVVKQVQHKKTISIEDRILELHKAIEILDFEEVGRLADLVMEELD